MGADSWGAKLAGLDEEAAGHASQCFGPALSPSSWGLLFLLPGGWNPLQRALGWVGLAARSCLRMAFVSWISGQREPKPSRSCSGLGVAAWLPLNLP